MKAAFGSRIVKNDPATVFISKILRPRYTISSKIIKFWDEFAEINDLGADFPPVAAWATRPARKVDGGAKEMRPLYIGKMAEGVAHRERNLKSRKMFPSS